MTAKKNDSGKVDLSLVPMIAVIRLAEALQVGEKKYGRYNYCGGMELSRMVGAMLRHAFAYYNGEEFDTDGQHHLGSVMANCAMILRQAELGTLKDDRFISKNHKFEVFGDWEAGYTVSYGVYDSRETAQVVADRVGTLPGLHLRIEVVLDDQSPKTA